MITPSSVAIPNNAIKPTPAEMLKGIPRINKENTPPMAAMWMAVNISSAYITDRNAKNNRRKIKASAAGTATESLAFASLRFSNCPPYVA